MLTGFWEFGEDGTVVPDEEFGTYEKTSDDPLTVEYKINPDAAWSDGEPIDCDDVDADLGRQLGHLRPVGRGRRSSSTPPPRPASS